MSRAAKEGLHKLQQYLASTKSRLTKIINGQGEPGTRAAPAMMGKTDAEIGLRLDYGDKFVNDGKEYRRYKLQVNKQASNPTLKELAAKDSHKVLAEADMQINPVPDNADQAAADFFRDLEEDLEAKAKK